MAYNLILQGVVGSTAYGLATDNSDVDQIGVFVRDISELIGLFSPKQSYVSHDPDRTIHEVGKYISLAAKCNPTVLELLYATDFTFKTELGQLLIDNRYAFLSTKYVRSAYGGYATSQIKKRSQTVAILTGRRLRSRSSVGTASGWCFKPKSY